MSNLQKYFGFTFAEMKALQHRLDCDSGLMDAFEEDVIDGKISADALQDVIDALGRAEWSTAAAINAEYAGKVIVDCIEGSTLAGIYYDLPMVQGRYLKWMRGAAEKIEGKLGVDRIRVPYC